MTSQSSDALTVVSATVIPWNRLPGAAVVDVGPPTGGAIELPGPRTRPVMPHLEVSASPAGRVAQGDGKVAALAIRDDEVIALPAPPRSVSARSDGLWALFDDSLVHHDRQGHVQRRVAASGMGLIGAAHDAVWLVGAEQAWLVEAGGTTHGPFAWRDPLTALATGDRLCARDRRDGRKLMCLARDGSQASVALAGELQPLEHPLLVEADRLITLQGATLRVRRAAAIAGEWTVQAAGIDAAKAGFVVTAGGGKITVWQAAGAARSFPPMSSASLSAAAVDGDAVTLYGQGLAVTHRG